MSNQIKIADRFIGEGSPCFIVAEISANHNQSFDKAKNLVRLAKESGADAVKLQTYTPDTMTINCDNEYFTISEGPWKGQILYDLYKKAYTPWEWQADLKKYADEIGIILFSTPFDSTAVDFLEKIDIPVYKIASFELVDTPLLEYVASKGKPVILSTGMATEEEISLAVNTIQKKGVDLILLKCTSDYPAVPESMNLRSMQKIKELWNVPVGLSDHSMSPEVVIAAVAQGAVMIEKHFIENRDFGGPDAHFSMEPEELTALVNQIRIVEKSLGTTTLGITKSEENNLIFRRSLFAVKDIGKGEVFSKENMRSIRPGYGLAPRYYNEILGKRAIINIKSGSPLTWDLIE
jgi:pseudaminic acid synthase